MKQFVSPSLNLVTGARQGSSLVVRRVSLDKIIVVLFEQNAIRPACVTRVSYYADSIASPIFLSPHLLSVKSTCFSRSFI